LVEIVPENPQGGIDELNCLVFSEDLDGQQIHYSYEWLKNGHVTSFYTDYIPSEELQPSDTWQCRSTASDGIDTSIVGSSPEVVIESSCIFGECDFFIPLDTDLGMDFQHIEGSDLIGVDFSLISPFYLMSTEVTQAMFEHVMQYDSRVGETMSFGEGDNYPAYYVNWHMAAHYANTVGGMMNEELCYECTGSFENVICEEILSPYECQGYSLPTEAEWELAAQSGTSEDFWTGNGILGGGTYSSNTCQVDVFIDDGHSSPSLLNYAWYCGNNTQNGTKIVGQKEPNAFGLYDMHGNVWEWTADWWGCSFPTSDGSWCSIENPKRSFRGGGWESTPNDMRSMNRNELPPTTRRNDVGFRLRKKSSTSNQ
jgi:formylglycine-generating enzyme required for sulfatase activity